MDAAADLHAADCDCEMCKDIGGIQFHAEQYAAMFEGEAPPCEDEARETAARRLREGTSDPVWQVEIALDRAVKAVRRVRNRHAKRGCEDSPNCTLCHYCRVAGYGFYVFGEMWRCTAEEYQSLESTAERRRQLIADFEADPEKYLSLLRKPAAD